MAYATLRSHRQLRTKQPETWEPRFPSCPGKREQARFVDPLIDPYSQRGFNWSNLDALELLDAVGDGDLGRQALDARSAEEAYDAQGNRIKKHWENGSFFRNHMISKAVFCPFFRIV